MVHEPQKVSRLSSRTRDFRAPCHRAPIRTAALVVLALVVWSGFSPPGSAGDGQAVGGEAVVVYQPPVAGPIVDDWRPPDHPFGAGNRGVDYFARPGERVFAAADGVVSFAGKVGSSLFVVVAHADGRRTTVGFVAVVLVKQGDRVTRGTTLALAAGPVHFGVRRGAVYEDPRQLFLRSVRLVE